MSTDLIYITGASCAGKTTLGAELKDRFLVESVDIDSFEYKPHTAWLQFLQWRGAEHLHEAMEAMTPQRFVTGIVWPHSIIDSSLWTPARKAGVDVHFVLLDTPWAQLRSRLKERTDGRPRAEVRELLDFNKNLADTLRKQTLASRHGLIVHPGRIGLTELADELVSGAYSTR